MFAVVLETGRRTVDDVDRHLRAIRVQLAVYACTLRRTIDAERGRRLGSADIDRLREDFLALVSDDLRSSLEAIRATLDFVDGSAGTTEKDMVLEAMRQAHGRLESLVNRGLTYFDWLANRPRGPAIITDLNAVAASILVHVPRLRGPHISFRVSRSEAPCPAAIAERHILEVLRALLENALEFSRGLVHVRLDIRRAGDEIQLAVSDGGQGFPATLAEELFYPFAIADPLHCSRGMGLGLALARAIVEAHCGRMSAQSAGPGTGATFTVRLPVCDGEVLRPSTPIPA